MDTSRRAFLRTAAAGAVVPVLGPAVLDALERRLEAVRAACRRPPPRPTTTFWAEIRKVFPVPAGYINLENGYSSPQPAPTFDAFQRHQAAINGGLSFYMRRKKAGDLRRGQEAAGRAGRLPGRRNRHHAQHDRVARHRDPRHRPRARRRGRDVQPGLRVDAGAVPAAVAPPRPEVRRDRPSRSIPRATRRWSRPTRGRSRRARSCCSCRTW